MKGITMSVNDSIACMNVHENFTNKQFAFEWDSMNWNQAVQFVNRIQIRIMKAVIAGKQNLVKRLQYLLTHSFYAKALAVRRVTTSKGKHTPGIDRITWNESSKKMEAVYRLSNRNYNSKPLKRVYIEKYGKAEKRPLIIPAMHDRAMQALHLLTLDPIAETTAKNISFGFRKYRSTHDAMSHIFNLMAKKNSGSWVLEGDIKGCFDNIQHKWLMDNIPMNKRILNNKGKKWIVNKYWKTIDTRQWVFMQGNKRLLNAGDTPIVRHIALKLDKHPYLDSDYFEARKISQRRKKSVAYLKTTAAYLFRGLSNA
jgi:RNA-directed DNA polymerase